MVISFVGAVVLAILSFFEHFRSIRPSFILNIYLLFTVLFDIERSRSYALEPELDRIATIFATRVAVKLFLAIFESRGKRKLLLPAFADCPPETTIGIYKGASFWWLNELFKNGFSNSLSVDDLFQLDKHLQADYLHHALGTAWDRCKSSRIARFFFKKLTTIAQIVTRKGPHSLFAATLKKLKWPILAVVPARLCLIGFNFCQPFLIHRAVDFSQQATTDQTSNIGYGLIGAYVLVFVGIAVSRLARRLSLLHIH